MDADKNKRKASGLYGTVIKRVMDFLLSLLALVVLSPVLLITAILVRIKLGSPVIFKQDRPGKDERIFVLYKFRSMTDQKDENGRLLPDAKRLPRFGKILRSTSLDELPELVNILKGDMSIVGPRPWSVSYLKYFTPEEHRRHEVRPGLTGLAQVNGRTASDWGERLRYDIEYVDNISFLNDFKIVLKTIKKVFVREGIVGAEEQGNFDEYRRKQWESGIVPKPEEK